MILKMKKVLRKKRDDVKLKELKKKEHHEILKIRQNRNYGIDEFYVSDKDLEILVDLHMYFIELAKNGKVSKAYEKINEYATKIYDVSGVFDTLSKNANDSDYEEYEGYEEYGNYKLCRVSLIERFSLELEYKLYDSLGEKVSKVVCDIKKCSVEEMERLKRIEKYIILGIREKINQYTTYIEEGCLEKLARLHLECLSLIKNDYKARAHIKVQEYTKELGLVAGLYSKNELNMTHIIDLIKTTSIKKEKEFIGFLSKNYKEKLSCINKSKSKIKVNDNATCRCCNIM